MDLFQSSKFRQNGLIARLSAELWQATITTWQASRPFAQGVPFASLSQAEVRALATVCVTVRPAMMIFLQSVKSFHIQQLDKAAIGKLWVPPMVIGILQCWPFSYYLTTQHSSPQDARNVACTPATYVPPLEPITVGISPPQQHVLIDGFHRAVAFHRCGPATGSIPAYIPDTPVAATQPTP
jgi:hypothetical protein